MPIRAYQSLPEGSRDRPIDPVERRRRQQGRAGVRWVRLGWLLLAASAALPIAVAFYLVPDPAGHGTHTQLGLPPCGFLLATGLPCPGCGLTTSMTHMAHLDVVSALDAHPVGAVLFVLLVAAVPLALLGAARGWPFAQAFERLRAYPLSLVVAGLLVLHWIVELAVVTPGLL